MTEEKWLDANELLKKQLVEEQDALRREQQKQAEEGNVKFSYSKGIV